MTALAQLQQDFYGQSFEPSTQSTPPVALTHLAQAIDIGGSPVTAVTTTAPFVVTANTTLPASYRAGTILQVIGANGGGARVTIDGYAGTVLYTGRAASGTAAAPSAVTIDRVMAGLSAFGYGTTDWSSGARSQILLNAAETWTDTAQGSYIDFQTTTVGGTTTAARMRLSDAGFLLLGASPNVSGTELFQSAGGARATAFRVNSSTGPTITAGNGAPGGTAPSGSLYLRQDGGVGTRLYVNQDSATSWLAVAGV